MANDHKPDTITHHSAKQYFKDWLHELEHSKTADSSINEKQTTDQINHLSWAIDQLDQLESNEGYFN